MLDQPIQKLQTSLLIVLLLRSLQYVGTVAGSCVIIRQVDILELEEALINHVLFSTDFCTKLGVRGQVEVAFIPCCSPTGCLVLCLSLVAEGTQVG